MVTLDGTFVVLVFVRCGEVYEFISCALNYISDTMFYVLAIQEEKVMKIIYNKIAAILDAVLNC